MKFCLQFWQTLVSLFINFYPPEADPRKIYSQKLVILRDSFGRFLFQNSYYSTIRTLARLRRKLEIYLYHLCLVTLLTIHDFWSVGSETRFNLFMAFSTNTVINRKRAAGADSFKIPAIETLARQRNQNFSIQFEFGGNYTIISAARYTSQNFTSY